MIPLSFLLVSFLFWSVDGDVYSSMYSVQPALLLDETLKVAECYQDYHLPSTGYDYQLCPYQMNETQFFVFTIHGGNIEFQTSDLTTDMAYDPTGKTGNWSKYYFEGLRSSNNSALHVTATHYDDPTILSMIYNIDSMTSSLWCVSNHGYSYDDPEICVGGESALLRNNTITTLTEAFPNVAVLDGSVDPYCSSIRGISPENVVNRCDKGLQLEMSTGLRNRFQSDAAYRMKFAQVVRATVLLSYAEASFFQP